MNTDPGLYSTAILKRILCLFLQSNATSDRLNCMHGWFSLSKVALLLNTSKFRKIWRRSRRTFFRMVGGYAHKYPAYPKRIDLNLDLKIIIIIVDQA